MVVDIFNPLPFTFILKRNALSVHAFTFLSLTLSVSLSLSLSRIKHTLAIFNHLVLYPLIDNQFILMIFADNKLFLISQKYIQSFYSHVSYIDRAS